MKSGAEFSAKIYFVIYSGITLSVIAIYAFLIDLNNNDIKEFLIPWYQYIVSNGRFSAFADNFSNYTPPYLYLLSIGTLANGWISPFFTIKLLSILGAIFLACCVYVLLRQFLRRGPASVAALSLLLLPSVVVNSVVWGQCDAIYTGFIVLAVAFSLQRRDLLTTAMFGAAIAFKLQAIFMAPFGLVLLLSRKIRPWSLLLSASVYCLLMLPARLAGRPVMELARIYLDQADYYRDLSLNAPNVWTYIEYFKLVPYDIGTKIGIAVAALIVLAIAIVADIRKMTGKFDLMLIAVLSSIAVPYFLPRMHDRYFFMADVLSFVLACSFRSIPTIAAALLIGIGTPLASADFLFDFTSGAAIGGLFMTPALVLVATMFIVRAFPRSAGWLPMARRLSHIDEAPSPA